MSKTSGMVLLTGTSVPELAGKISKLLKYKFYKPVSVFANGEIMVKIPVSRQKKSDFLDKL